MPHSRTWQQSLSRFYGDQEAAAILAKAQRYYDDYWAQHSTEKNRANRTSLKRRILPGLSIYHALLEENDDQPEVMEEVGLLFRAAFFSGMKPGIRLLNRLPDPFPLVKPVLKRMSRDEYLPGATEILEDSPDCFAMNVYRCFILDTLAAHDAQELTSLFCNTDDWLAEEMPKVGWERKKTIGRGDDLCDFCWRRLK
jgi:hypothetical protein